MQTYVSQLRKALGSDVIVTRPAGYELVVEPDGFDLHRFERLVAEARASEPAVAAERLREALAIWRGPPLAEFSYERWAQAEIGRLTELRLSTLQDRIDADLASAVTATSSASSSASSRSTRSRSACAASSCSRSTARAGRRRLWRRTARRGETLVETLGIEPGAVLRQLERQILDQDPALDHVTAEPPAAGPVRPAPSLQSRVDVVRRPHARAARDSASSSAARTCVS